MYYVSLITVMKKLFHFGASCLKCKMQVIFRFMAIDKKKIYIFIT